MIKECKYCHHVGELTWRDGKYHCAMCDKEVSETEPEVQRTSVVNNTTCPICKNREDNLFDGTKYRCALCGTRFDLQQRTQQATSATPISDQNSGIFKKAWEALKRGDGNMLLGVIFIFIFWPVSIIFFYRFYKSTKS